MKKILVKVSQIVEFLMISNNNRDLLLMNRNLNKKIEH